ncbi:NrdH-like glutaredoxin [Microbacterium phage Eden]|uniref:NrdH-like glutaredoxin n=1 Tax=Microbacterium phage Eden TaxID=2250289 RepID=A0A345KWC7_9CAUD|nr:thioredoxin [Microbacterium phage Eden]AXH47329.1 NrdH-like glutaredoxin [Microbacterium phage Eden]
MVTLYSTPTCARCKVAEAQLIKAGLLAAKVDLTEHPDKLAELKERLDVPMLDLPVLELNGELFGMVDLRNIVRSVN